MMDTYVLILTSKDLKHLGGETEQERRDAWDKIQDVFEEQTKGHKMTVEISAKAEKIKLIIDIAILKTLIRAVEILGRVSEAIQEEFIENGCVITEISDLVSVRNQIIQMEMHLDILNKQEEELLPVKTEGEDVTVNKAMFIKCCVRMSDYKKRDIRLDNISMIEFCINYRDYLDWQESSKNKNQRIAA